MQRLRLGEMDQGLELQGIVKGTSWELLQCCFGSTHFIRIIVDAVAVVVVWSKLSLKVRVVVFSQGLAQRCRLT
ncbi:hypothetical protein FGO68_gene1270 [Halteria grandinella]|uniref:Uncharacterized protein n=1 Tax=Halteria grandinella TaxID=5974 RepID=A0A8J8NPU7_HALGN|nr:hypothetical protein FGO68_gene1270 [Halteria grandinella]